MPPAENATPESRLSVDQAGDNSLLQPEMYHPMIDSQVPSSVSSMGKNRREDSWDTDTTEVSFSGRHIDLKPWSETQRFSGSLPTSVSPMPSNRLSRSFKGIDRLKKRHSHGSTIRSSFTPSLWSNRLSTSSSASTLSLGGVGHGELAMATVAPSQESRDSKRPKLSPSSSQVNLDGLNVANSQRQSSEVSLSNCGDSGFFWETISPSPYDGRPEIRILQNGPESVESRMKDLAIDDADPQNPGKALSIISEASSAGHAAQDIQALPDRQGPHLVPRSPNIHHDSKSFSSHTSDNGSYIRSPAAPVTLTPCTSVDYGDGDDDVDPDEDSLSDVSGETEESFIEAFNATSLHPDVLPQVLAMRRQIMSLVEAGIMEWMRSCTSGTPSQQPSGSPSSGTSGGSDASKNQGGRGVKRNFSGDQSNDNGLGGSGDGGRDGDGNGDDDGDGDGDGGPKRRKGASPPEEQTIKGPPLACPFVKRYPGQVWPTVCQTGFLTVSRLKCVPVLPLPPMQRISFGR